MNNEIERAERALTNFEKTKAVDELELAIRSLEKVDTPYIVGGGEGARRKVTCIWLAVLGAIDHNMDKKFDPKDLPAANLTPLPTSAGVQYPSGIDPQAIPDTEVRARYEAALAENRLKIQHYRFQEHLRRLDTRVSTEAGAFIHRFYTNAPVDRKEVEKLVSDAKLSREHAQILINANLLDR